MKHFADKPYYSLDCFLKEQFGEKIYKIAIDAGRTCPVRDGTLDTRGCLFCSAGGSGEFAAHGSSISEQLRDGMNKFGDKHIGRRFIAYFQSFTNTYAPTELLRRQFSESLAEPSVAGISIATRPDCISEECIRMLRELRACHPGKFIWVELGLQTIHESTARLIRRGYPLSCFEDTMGRLTEARIPVIVHMIIGLPHEGAEENLAGIRYLNAQHPFGIKLHQLHVIRGTDLARHPEWYPSYSLEDYITLLIQLLEQMSPDIVIHRLTGDGPRNLTIAPEWSLHKRNVLNTLHRRMREQNTWQGKYYGPDIIGTL